MAPYWSTDCPLAPSSAVVGTRLCPSRPETPIELDCALTSQLNAPAEKLQFEFHGYPLTSRIGPPSSVSAPAREKQTARPKSFLMPAFSSVCSCGERRGVHLRTCTEKCLELGGASKARGVTGVVGDAGAPLKFRLRAASSGMLSRTPHVTHERGWVNYFF